MSYMLSTRPKFLYLTNKQLQTISKRLLSSTSKTSINSSKLLNSSKTFFKSLPKTEQQQYQKQGKNVALVSGIIIVGSYIAFNQSNYYNLDTLPSSPQSSQVAANAAAGSFAKPPKLLEDKKLFSTSTSSMHQENSISHQQHKEGIFLLNDEQVDTKLRQFEESYFVNRGKGVMRYDICQLPSNSPIEDDRAEEIIQVPILQDNNIKTTTDWLFFGVFDGHGGWTTSSKLRDELINYVINELGTIYKPVQGEENLRYVPNSATIDQAIKNGFLKLDHEIVNKNIEKLLTDGNKAKAAELLMPALSGSCALLSFYDTNSKMLKVAVTGDSRAILGSFKNNHWTARQLSIDQTGSNPTEVARIISEHPDEPKVIRNGRVLGSLEPTRAFGDCRYKLPASIQERIYKQFFGKRLPNYLTSPPYVTAEPVITTTKINPDNNDFLVMASDGLYEMLTNEEIVGLVVKWMEREKMVKPQKSFWNFFGKVGENKLPEVEDITMDKASKKPIRKSTGGGSFLLQDNNVSTHLIRNALSNGGSKEQTSMIISIPNPVSRRYRDDLTVTVVFFGNNLNEANENGALEINASATAGGVDASKPKL
ncbi:PTC5 [Candida margitis]|uniref:PTC5 n=1 Tax=Candida margitis TaxID=1775924 RepID=UPI002227CF12|nr:PTC5 [Candida margitis]KAI5970684.1 PTC5 [Candida margitis]